MVGENGKFQRTEWILDTEVAPLCRVLGARTTHAARRNCVGHQPVGGVVAAASRSSTHSLHLDHRGALLVLCVQRLSTFRLTGLLQTLDVLGIEACRAALLQEVIRHYRHHRLFACFFFFALDSYRIKLFRFLVRFVMCSASTVSMSTIDIWPCL